VVLHGGRLVISGLNAEARRVMERSGFPAKIKET